MKAKKAVKPAKKPAAKKAAAKPKAKPVAKPKTSALSKLKNALLGKSKPNKAAKPAPKPVAKPKAKPAVAAKAAAKPKSAISSLRQTTPSTIIAPKGMMSEAQLRRMSERDYMNDAQLSFFRHRLLQMREEVLARELDVKERLHQREVFADPADRATAEEEHWLDLRLRERESLLLRKIDEAIRRIDAKEFGYCEKTGDPIGIPRLLARPTATVCVDIKGQDERVEAQFRDR